MKQQEANPTKTSFDVTRRYVRVCEQRPDGFIEFEFAIGDPALCVELMLPEAAFHEFCLANEVIVLDPAKPGQGDWVARLNKASLQEIEDAVQPSRERE
jgi:phenol hydroxylase P0 protein